MGPTSCHCSILRYNKTSICIGENIFQNYFKCVGLCYISYSYVCRNLTYLTYQYWRLHMTFITCFCGEGRIRTYRRPKPADLQSAPFDHSGTSPSICIVFRICTFRTWKQAFATTWNFAEQLSETLYRRKSSGMFIA